MGKNHPIFSYLLNPEVASLLYWFETASEEYAGKKEEPVKGQSVLSIISLSTYSMYTQSHSEYSLNSLGK